MNESVDVNVFGKNYKIQGEKRERIEKYAKFLNKKLLEYNEALSNRKDDSAVYVLAALEITKLYFEELEKNQKTDNMINKIKLNIDKVIK